MEEELSGGAARGKHVDGSGKVEVSLTMQACSRGKCDGDDDGEVGSGQVFRNHFAKQLCALSRRKQLQQEEKEDHKSRRQTAFTKTVDVQYEVVVSIFSPIIHDRLLFVLYGPHQLKFKRKSASVKPYIRFNRCRL